MTIDRRSVLTGLAALAGVACRAEPLAAVSESSEVSPVARANLYECEGCEAVHERDPAGLMASLVLAGPDEPGERMVLEGVVYVAGGTVPAEGVVIYAHHTNAEGLYANGSPETDWSRRHGRLRGWVKTGADGRYRFDTVKPAPYPDRTMPAHVHLFLAEPGRREYYIDDVVFEGEFGVTPDYRAAAENRGGSGIVRLERQEGVWLARRDIVLERHPG